MYACHPLFPRKVGIYPYISTSFNFQGDGQCMAKMKIITEIVIIIEVRFLVKNKTKYKNFKIVIKGVVVVKNESHKKIVFI